MKAIKTLIKIVLVIVIVAVLAIIALPLWIGPVAKGVASAVVPSKTGTEFGIGNFALNPYNGTLAVGDVRLGNPSGFSPETAFTLGSLDVKVNVPSVLGDVIVVDRVVIKDVFVAYVFSQTGDTNFGVIMDNAKGPAEDNGAEDPESAQIQEEAEAKPPKKVIIDLLSIEGLTVQIGPLKVPMPPITLTGIGRKSNGITFKEAWQQVSEEVLKGVKGVNALGGNVKDLAEGLSAFGIGVTRKSANAVGAGTDATLDTVNKGVGTSVDAAAGAVNKSTEAAADAANKTKEAATKLLNGLFK